MLAESLGSLSEVNKPLYNRIHLVLAQISYHCILKWTFILLLKQSKVDIIITLGNMILMTHVCKYPGVEKITYSETVEYGEWNAVH